MTEKKCTCWASDNSKFADCPVHGDATASREKQIGECVEVMRNQGGSWEEMIPQLAYIFGLDGQRTVEPTLGDVGEVRTVSSTGAEKGVKIERFDLIPARPITLAARHFGVGANKYAERNWERGYEWSKSFAALNRHLWLFWSGEDIDEETGSLHIVAVMWHAMVLTEFVHTHPDLDDRPGAQPRAASRITCVKCLRETRDLSGALTIVTPPFEKPRAGYLCGECRKTKEENDNG